MRYIILLVFLITAVNMKGEFPQQGGSKNYELYIDEYIIVNFEKVNKNGRCGEVFTTYLNNDTIRADLSDYDAFMKSIKPESYYKESSVGLANAYVYLFGINLNVYSVAYSVYSAAYSVYLDKVDNPDITDLLIEGFVELESGEKAGYTAYRTKGIFMKYRPAKFVVTYDYDYYAKYDNPFETVICPVYPVWNGRVEKLVVLPKNQYK